MENMSIIESSCAAILSVFCQTSGQNEQLSASLLREVAHAETLLKSKQKWLKSQPLSDLFNITRLESTPCKNPSSISPRISLTSPTASFMDLVLHTRELLRTWDMVHISLVSLSSIRASASSLTHIGGSVMITPDGSIGISYQTRTWDTFEAIYNPIQLIISLAVGLILGVTHLLQSLKIRQLEEMMKRFTSPTVNALQAHHPTAMTRHKRDSRETNPYLVPTQQFTYGTSVNKIVSKPRPTRASRRAKAAEEATKLEAKRYRAWQVANRGIDMAMEQFPSHDLQPTAPLMTSTKSVRLATPRKKNRPAVIITGEPIVIACGREHLEDFVSSDDDTPLSQSKQLQ
jgi:hypothetical protein